MSVFNVPRQTYQVGSTVVGSFDKPNGAKLISLQIAATTDWQSGAAGRTMNVLVEKSYNSGASFTNGSVQGGGVTPNMGHGGAFPTLVEMDCTFDPDGTTKYRVTVTVGGGAIDTAATVTVA